MVVHTNAWLCDNKYKLLNNKNLLDFKLKTKMFPKKLDRWVGVVDTI